MSHTFEFPTLVAALDAAEGWTRSGFTFLGQGNAETFFSFHDLRHEAMRRAAHLRALGLKQGDRVALVVPDGEDFVPTFFGAVWAGLVPVPLYPPASLGRFEGYLDTMVAILTKARPAALVTSQKLQQLLWSGLGRVPSLRAVIEVESLKAPAPKDADTRPAKVQPDDLCFLQFTSGSTATPKGVMVTHENLRANAWAVMRDGARTDPDRDHGVSWLPLYHDMGLIGFVISPLFHRMPVTYIPTLAFIRNASLWFDVIHKVRGTISFAPNFAYALAVKRAKPEQLAKWDLSSMRMFGCGAEPIQPKTLRTFVDTFAKAGLRPTAMLPCYGMAESTLAISFIELADELRTDVIDAELYRDAHLAQAAEGERVASGEALEVVNCGKCFPGHEVAAFDDKGRRLADRAVGELWVRGPSVSPGYFEDPAGTAAAFSGGWLKTGDLGYLVDGDIFITGRKKDLIIINGRNYDPQRIEWLIDELPEVRKGSAVAFSRPGATSEELVVVLEARPSQPEALVTAVKERVAEQLQLQVADVVLCPVGTLPKTSSGKLQRALTRRQYLEGTVGTKHTRLLGGGERLVLARHLVLSVVARVRHRARGLWRRSQRSVATVVSKVARPRETNSPQNHG